MVVSSLQISATAGSQSQAPALRHLSIGTRGSWRSLEHNLEMGAPDAPGAQAATHVEGRPSFAACVTVWASLSALLDVLVTLSLLFFFNIY